MNDEEIVLELFLDIGNKDALWVFQDSSPDFKVPDKSLTIF